MTCYQRIHEVILGVTRPAVPIDWEALFWDWRGFTNVHDRDHMLGRMGVDVIDEYLFPGADLHGYTGLIISGRVNQELLYQERAKIRAFLDDGKVVAFSGETFRAWLPGAPGSVHVHFETPDLGTLTLAEHELLADLTVEDLGPSFVYGYNPTPPGAEVLASLPGDRAVVYVDRTSTNGTILAHAGVNLTSYTARDGPERDIMPRLIAWINKEARGASSAPTLAGAPS